MASTNVGSIHYDLDLKTEKFDKAADSIKRKTQAIGDKMTSIGKTMTVGLTLPIVAGMGFAVKAASDFNETINKVDVAFKDQAKSVKAWGETTLKNIGLARGTALDMAATFGDMSTSMGLSTEEAYKMSTSLVDLAGDLASFKNINIEEATTALAGVFTGETESLKRLGIIMTDTNVKAFAMKNGFKGSWEEMSQADKVTWRYKYVIEQTKNAQGDFARTSDGVANQMRYTQERVKQLSQEFGAKLLPMTGRVLEYVNRLLDKFSSLTDSQQDLIIKIGLVAAAAGPMLMVFGKIITVVGSVISVLSTAIFWEVAAVVAAIAAAGYLMYKNWDKILPVVKYIGSALRDLYNNVLLPLWRIMASQLSIAFEQLKDSFNRSMEALKPFKGEIAAFAKVVGGLLVVAILAPTVAIGALIVLIARLAAWFAQASAWIQEKFLAVMEKIPGATSIWQGSIRSLGSAFAMLGFSNDAAKDAANRQKEAQKQLKEALDNVKTSTDFLKDAQYQLEGSNLAVERAQRNYTDAVKQYGPGSLEAREALHQLKGAQDDQKDASKNAEDATKKHQDAMNKLKEQGDNIKGLQRVQGEAKRTGDTFQQQNHKPASFRNAILNNFAPLGGILRSIGINMISGLIGGMGSMWGPLVQKAASLAASVASKFKSMLKIKSPSRVFFGFGENIVQGLVDGINNTKMQAKTSVQSMANTISQQPQVAPGNTSIYGNINIGSKQDADYLLNRIDRGQQLAGMGII